MIVNLFVLVCIKQLKGLFDFVFLVLGELSPFLAFSFVHR